MAATGTSMALILVAATPDSRWAVTMASSNDAPGLNLTLMVVSFCTRIEMVFVVYPT